MDIQRTEREKEFYKKNKNIFYRTSNAEIGQHRSMVKRDKNFGKDSSFTSVRKNGFGLKKELSEGEC